MTSYRTNEEIIREFCNENLTTHTNHSGTWVETKNSCGSVDEFVKKLMQHIEDNPFEEWLKTKELAKSAAENNKLQYVLKREPYLMKRMTDLTDSIAGYFIKGESLTINCDCCEVTFKFK